MVEGPAGHSSIHCITGITSMAMRKVITELAAAYERHSRRRVAVESVGGVDAARRIKDGEAFDFDVLAAQAIDRIAAAGRIDPDTQIELARSGAALAVPTGVSPPNIGSEMSVRDAVLAARSIGYSTGPSGRYLTGLFERWGIAETIAPRLVMAPAGVAVATLVARREVQIGFQQLSELLHVPGIDVVGALPLEIQEVTVFSGAVCASSLRPDLAKELLAYCASPAAADVKRRRGIEP